MSDLAPRPRGGWQTGSALRAAVPVEVLAGAESSPDCYTVEREAGGVFRVSHFPTAATRRACCTVLVTRREGETDGDALHRAYLLSDRQHQQGAPCD